MSCDKFFTCTRNTTRRTETPHPTPPHTLSAGPALKLNWFFYRAQKPKPDPEKTRTRRRRGWGWRWYGSLFYHFILKLLINGVFSSSTSYLCTYRTYTHVYTYVCIVCSYAMLETCALTPVFVACFMGLVGDRANGLGDKSVAWGLVWMLAPTYHTIR